MTFPLCDLNIRLNSTFIAAVDQALQSDRAELVLVHAITRHHALFVAGDYLRMRARTIAEAGLRKVYTPGSADSDEKLEDVIEACKPGDLVFLPELRSSSPRHAVGTAAQFVSKGATVVATIHGLDAKYTRARLEKLWEDELSNGLRPAHAALPPYNLIAYSGSVQEVPVRAPQSA